MVAVSVQAGQGTGSAAGPAAPLEKVDTGSLIALSCRALGRASILNDSIGGVPGAAAGWSCDRQAQGLVAFEATERIASPESADGLQAGSPGFLLMKEFGAISLVRCDKRRRRDR
jgi:hypothetical protein